MATSYTLLLTDADKLVRKTTATDGTIVVPTNATVPFPIGTRVDFDIEISGTLTFSPSGGVTINSKGNVLVITGPHATAHMEKIATDTWFLWGTEHASNMTFTPAGTIASTTVQAAIEEVSTEAGTTWDLIVDENGTSFSNWTNSAWTGNSIASNGTEFFSASGNRQAALTSGGGLLGPIVVYQAEVQFVAFTGANTYVGIGLISRSPTENNNFCVGIDLRSNIGDGTGARIGVGEFQQYGNTVNMVIPTINTAQWYTLRGYRVGTSVALYLDGTHRGTFEDNNADGYGSPKRIDTIGIFSSVGSVKWRNIKAWVPSTDLPA